MTASQNKSENECSTDERMKELEEAIAYLQRDVAELTEKLGKTNKRIDTWPFVKIPA